MKIDASKLKESKTENFKESLASDDLDLDTYEIKYQSPINISTDVKKESQILYIKTHFSAIAEFRCSRCLKDCNVQIEKDFDFDYPLDKSNYIIDITHDLREEIILGYPVKFLCKEDCLGLCPKCGKDLNEGDCSCQMKS